MRPRRALLRWLCCGRSLVYENRTHIEATPGEPVKYRPSLQRYGGPGTECRLADDGRVDAGPGRPAFGSVPGDCSRNTAKSQECVLPCHVGAAQPAGLG